jgi:hypothetical protein
VRGKRGQAFLIALRNALEVLPEKRLIAGELATADGAVCAIGALGKARGIDVAQFDPEDADVVGDVFKISGTLAREIMHTNDDDFRYHTKRIPLYWVPESNEVWRCERILSIPETPEERYERMLDWTRSKIIT